MPSNWYDTFFRGVAVDFWREAMTPETTKPEVDFIEGTLSVGPNSRLLDVPCGHGRHSIELALRGHRVTGVDISPDCLAEARKSGAPVEWRLSEMRDLPWTSEFDGAFCFGNSFGYLDPAGAEEFLSRLAAVLNPGGKIAIEYGTAAESILPTLAPMRWHRIADMFMLSKPRYDVEHSRLDIDYTFIRGAEVATRTATCYVLTVSEIRRLLNRAGFDSITLAGGFQGEPYQLGTPRLVISAQKIRA